MKEESVRIEKRYSEALKIQVVEGIDSGELTVLEATRDYGCSKGSVYNWQRKYGTKSNKVKIVRVVMKNEKDRIHELESALAKAYIKLEVYEKMMELAKEEDGIEVKKNIVTGELELVRHEVKSRSTAKSSK